MREFRNGMLMHCSDNEDWKSQNENKLLLIETTLPLSLTGQILLAAWNHTSPIKRSYSWAGCANQRWTLALLGAVGQYQLQVRFWYSRPQLKVLQVGVVGP